MKTITKPTYKCEYCPKLYQRKDFAVKHETKCRKNPNNFKICHDCKHLNPEKAQHYYDTVKGEEMDLVNVFYCKMVEKYLHPLSVEFSDRGPYEFGDIENVPMKKECQYYEYKYEKFLKL